MKAEKLIYWTQAKLAIEKAGSVNELAKIASQAEAYKYALKQAKESVDVVNIATEIKLRAERKAGEYLQGMEKNKGGNPNLSPDVSSLKIKDLGISHNQSSKWQKIATIPEGLFEQHIEEIKLNGIELSTSKLLRSQNGLYTSNTGEWYTPKRVIDSVHKVLQGIDLDPCSTKEANKTVCALRYFTKEDDGLKHLWKGQIYMNPPYGNDIGDWVEKLTKEHTSLRLKEAIALLPARTDTNWFYMLRDYPKCFIKGRLNFSNYGSAPFPSCVVYLGNNIDKFNEIFSNIGDIYIRWSMLTAAR